MKNMGPRLRLICLLPIGLIALSGMGIDRGDFPSEGSVVGYVQVSDRREGFFVNCFSHPSKPVSELLDVAVPSCEGIELRFLQGGRLCKVESFLGADEKYHWRESEYDEDADQYEVPLGLAIGYKIPEGEDPDTLSFVGNVYADAVALSGGRLFADHFTLGDIRISPDDLQRMIGMRVVTNVNRITVTNYPPSRFQIVKVGGQKESVMIRWSDLALLSPHQNRLVVLDPETIVRFEVDCDPTIPAGDRMNEQQVRQLEVIITDGYRRKQREEADRQARELASETAKMTTEAFWQKVFSWSTLLTGALGVLGTLMLTSLYNWFIGMPDRWWRFKSFIGWYRFKGWLALRRARRSQRKAAKRQNGGKGVVAIDSETQRDRAAGR